MNLFTIGLVLDTIGKIFVGLAVLMVHRHMFREHSVDPDVLRAMRKEWMLTMIGILLIVIGAVLQLIFHFDS